MCHTPFGKLSDGGCTINNITQRSGEDHMNIHDLSTDERARALVALTGRWNELVDALTGIPGFTDRDIDTTLTAVLASFAHPLIGQQHLDDALHALRQAILARAAYTYDGSLPPHLEERPFPSVEAVWEALDDDVNHPLFQLLTATSMPCVECRRTGWDVTYWQPAVTGSPRCADHRIVAVHDGMGVGLVAS